MGKFGKAIGFCHLKSELLKARHIELHRLAAQPADQVVVVLVCADAIKMYSQGIAGNENDHTLFGNRSAAYLAIGLLDQALLDAQKAVTLEPAWAKGYFRLGCALENINEWEAALAAFSEGSKLEPGDKVLLKKVTHARKRLEEDVYAKNAAAAVDRHNLVLKLRNARHEDQKLAMLNQFKQSMTAPEWDLDDL